jgi:hypothetical protein
MASDLLADGEGMMPNLRAALRAVGGRRVTGQVVVPTPTGNGQVAQVPQNLLRATIVLTPMDPRKIRSLPEGQREWKLWSGTSTTKLDLNWNILPDNDLRRQYEVMSVADWSQAGFYTYDFVERRRPT